jgi:hypothetical protein
MNGNCVLQMQKSDPLMDFVDYSIISGQIDSAAMVLNA